MPTHIQWTSETWNPIAGCSIVSAGCKNCYAMPMAARLEAMGNPKYAGLTQKINGNVVWTGDVRLDEATIDAPRHWKQPRRVFVNSMSDLFHEAVPDAWLDTLFAVMTEEHRHTYQVLTKRPERMLAYMQANSRRWLAGYPRSVWLGVSVENQDTADQRIPLLLQTPAAVRFVSAEPLLGRIYLWPSWTGSTAHIGTNTGPFLGWVIAGGESGHGARPCDLRWLESLVEQCQEAEVPVFVKQLGARSYRSPENDGATGYELTLKDHKGGDIAEFPRSLAYREFPKGVSP